MSLFWYQPLEASAALATPAAGLAAESWYIGIIPMGFLLPLVVMFL